MHLLQKDFVLRGSMNVIDLNSSTPAYTCRTAQQRDAGERQIKRICNSFCFMRIHCHDYLVTLKPTSSLTNRLPQGWLKGAEESNARCWGRGRVMAFRWQRCRASVLGVGVLPGAPSAALQGTAHLESSPCVSSLVKHWLSWKDSGHTNGNSTMFLLCRTAQPSAVARCFVQSLEPGELAQLGCPLPTPGVCVLKPPC